jgi:DNA (cytosine-5)-methyltransferase 1
MKPRALDLFCCAGGAGMGLYRAGFDVTGVDINNQPHYPFKFRIADALKYPLEGFDFIWASPPCQFGSQLTPPSHRANHKNLIPATRDRLLHAKVPFVIENVPSTRRHLKNPIKLCGSMFGLKVRRHRFFELHDIFLLTSSCAHTYKPVLISGTHRRTYEPRYEYTAQECRDASGLDWMTRSEMDEGIPPAYSEYIGRAWLAQAAKQ